MTEGAVPAVDVDPNQLEMALLNLAVNAETRWGLGGVLTIGLNVEDVDDEDELGIVTGRYVVLSVRDTGEGMDSETLVKAVEPFFSTKGVGQGNGSGLVDGVRPGAAIRRCSTSRKRSVKGHDRADYGCRLPRKRLSPAASLRDVTQASARARILFVDDDLLIAGSTVALLEDLGHEVVEVHSARRPYSFSKADCLRTF